jgi:hypothetical protein
LVNVDAMQASRSTTRAVESETPKGPVILLVDPVRKREHATGVRDLGTGPLPLFTALSIAAPNQSAHPDDEGASHVTGVDDRLDAPYEEVDLRALRGVMRGSSLTDPSVAVPRPDQPSLPAGNPDVLPDRNAVLLPVAFALAVSVAARAVAVGDCGACAACAERRGAFASLGLAGPVPYRGFSSMS